MGLPLPLSPGTVIDGHYIVGDLISSGGFGAVYRGIDTSEGNRPCAIKETYDVTPAARRQALMEASVLFTVRSEHLPQIYDALEENGRFYLVMQLIEGQTLLSLLRSRIGSEPPGERQPHQYSSGPCSEQEVLNWLLPIMQVLQELHSRNPAVIHRDIKPGNIILTPRGTAVLVDFGLTRLYDPMSSTQTMVRAVTEGFSPLEQYVGKTSPQSDIYSMGATLYLLLTNRLPQAAIKRTVHDDLIAPRLLNPSLSPQIERALLKALALNVPDRYQSMREFAQALQAPVFTGYDDPTLAGPPVGNNGSAPPMQPTVPPAKSTAPVHAYGGVGKHAPASARGHPRHAGAAQQPAPVPYAQVPQAPPGYVMVPQSALVPARPLPAPSSQGCLWGVVQGVLAALLVLLLREQIYFYLATLMGFGFYILAGFTTTRRGGSFWRGLRAGYWAGIISTAVFWLALGLGLLIRLSQRIQADSAIAHRNGIGLPHNELARAWRAILPAFPTGSTPPGQSPVGNFVFYLLIGLLVASLLGLAGGIWGNARYRAKMRKVKYP
jgi:serine/threonine protein kinase